jgi:hypothetical protein
MKRIESKAMAAMRQLRCASVIAGVSAPIRVVVIADMFAS